MSVNKQIIHETLNSWLKAVKESEHGWIYLDSIQGSTIKRITVEGETIHIYANHIYPVESDQYGYQDNLKYTAIDLSYGDWDNFKNFMASNKPDKLYWKTFSDNSSDWMKERNITNETVRIQAMKLKNDRYERTPFNEYEANRLYDKRSGPNHYFKMLRTTPVKNYKDGEQFEA